MYSLLLQGYDYPRDHWDHMMGNGYGGTSIFMMIFVGLLFLIILAALIYFMIRSSQHGGLGPTGQPPSETPLEILKKRYARGEITKEEFDKIKQDLH